MQLIRDKRFRKCKKSRLHVDKRDVKKAQNFFVKKEKNVFENKLTECIGKPKDLWKAVMSLGLPNTSGGCIVVTFVENQIVKHDT